MLRYVYEMVVILTTVSYPSSNKFFNFFFKKIHLFKKMDIPITYVLTFVKILPTKQAA